MSKVASNAGSNMQRTSDENNEQGRRKPSSRSAQQRERTASKKLEAEQQTKAKPQLKRKNKRSKKDNDTADEKGEEEKDEMVVEENEEPNEDDATNSEGSTTDSDTDSGSDDDATNNLHTDFDEDDEDEDEVMDDDFCAKRRRSLMGYNASFNYTRLSIEKLSDHPIVLRGCNYETMWDKKELVQLQEDLKLLYKKARQRIKTLKRDVRKLDDELQRKRHLYSKRTPSATEPQPEDVDGKKDLLKQRICGVMNSRGNPCQRTGFCPFHAQSNKSYAFYKKRDEHTPPSSEQSPDPDKETTMLASNIKEKQDKMQVSILLVAAAALERDGIDDNEASRREVQTPNQPQFIQQQQQQQQQPKQQQHQLFQTIVNNLPLQQQQMQHSQPVQHRPTLPSHTESYEVSSGDIPYPNIPQYHHNLREEGRAIPSLYELSQKPPPPFDFEPESRDQNPHSMRRNNNPMS
ncbi:hypothetical protein AKO1_013609 [Acrasis kona]|uniref:Uncharacterized protein n=1 Tax=Acrasis kona TaxID=1008807 RepID=A0AAW2YU50_9EUKA